MLLISLNGMVCTMPSISRKRTVRMVSPSTENIGARRLHTLLERLLEEVSFSAGDIASAQKDEPIRIDAEYVNSHLGELAENEDLSRYIL